MNKEDLIDLKKVLSENQSPNYLQDYISLLRCGRYYFFDATYKKYELQGNLDTKKAANIIITNFENAIRYYCSKHKEFDRMILSPFICPYVKKSSLAKYISADDFCEREIILNDDVEVLDDIVRINFFRLNVFNNNKKLSNIGDTFFIPNYNSRDWFNVSLSKLNNELLENGLELTNITNIEDLLDTNLKKEIIINFGKTKYKTKLLKK